MGSYEEGSVRNGRRSAIAIRSEDFESLKVRLWQKKSFGGKTVRLEPAVAKIFPNAKAVNEALIFLISSDAREWNPRFSNFPNSYVTRDLGRQFVVTDAIENSSHLQIGLVNPIVGSENDKLSLFVRSTRVSSTSAGVPKSNRALNPVSPFSERSPWLRELACRRQISYYEPHSLTVSHPLRVVTPVTRTANSGRRQPTARSTGTSQPNYHYTAQSPRATETTRSQLSANQRRNRISLVASRFQRRAGLGLAVAPSVACVSPHPPFLPANPQRKRRQLGSGTQKEPKGTPVIANLLIH